MTYQEYIFRDKYPSEFYHVPGISKTGFKRFRIFIRIDKLLARVLWQTDMDHLDLAVIRLLEEFQYFEIVTLDEKILCFPVNRIRPLKAYRIVNNHLF